MLDRLADFYSDKPPETISGLDVMGILDPGFEEVDGGSLDYIVANGVVGHFATLDEPPPAYYAMPTLERQAHAE